MNPNKPGTNKNVQSKPVVPNIQKKEATKADPKKPFGKH